MLRQRSISKKSAISAQSRKSRISGEMISLAHSSHKILPSFIKCPSSSYTRDEHISHSPKELPSPAVYPSNSGQEEGHIYCPHILQIIITPLPFLLEILFKMLYNGRDVLSQSQFGEKLRTNVLYLIIYHKFPFVKGIFTYFLFFRKV